MTGPAGGDAKSATLPVHYYSMPGWGVVARGGCLLFFMLQKEAVNRAKTAESGAVPTAFAVHFLAKSANRRRSTGGHIGSMLGLAATSSFRVCGFDRRGSVHAPALVI